MSWLIVVLAGLTAALVMIVLAVHALRRAAPGDPIDRAPDRPLPFGYATAWLAVRTADTMRLLEALDLTQAVRASWKGGIAAAYDEAHAGSHVFVSSPVAGWSFVIGLTLPQPAGADYEDRAGQLLAGLAAEFAEVQYYFTYPPLDLYGWSRWKDGRLVRAFAMGGEGVLWNAGRPTLEEKAAGLKLPPPAKGPRAGVWHETYTYPSEEQVIRLAAELSLDPTTIDRRDAVASLGFIGRAPGHWRLKRISGLKRALRSV